MPPSKSILTLLPVLSFVVSDQLVIPQVDTAVQSMLHDLANYTTYHAPDGAIAASPKMPVGAVELTAADSTPYWLENINHQGISAFGPSGYIVFRNVMDYGATGKDLAVSLPTSFHQN